MKKFVSFVLGFMCVGLSSVKAGVLKDIKVVGNERIHSDMIKNCGVGVALKNALPEVKELADYVTKYNYDDDGVIEFLKEVLRYNHLTIKIEKKLHGMISNE